MKATRFLSLLAVLSTTACGTGYKPGDSIPDKDEWVIDLKKPITVSPPVEGEIYSPYLPAEIKAQFPISDGSPQGLLRPGGRIRHFYGIMSTEEAEMVLEENDIIFENMGLSMGQWAYYDRFCNVAMPHFNPLEYGYLIHYQGTYLSIAFNGPQQLAVRRLHVIRTPQPANVGVTYLGKDKAYVFDWYVSGNPGLDKDWVPGTLLSASSQNGSFMAASEWSGGKTVPLPEDMSSFRFTATDPDTKKVIWKKVWTRLPN